VVREYSEAALGPELLASDDLMINDHIIPTFGEGGGQAQTTVTLLSRSVPVRSHHEAYQTSANTTVRAIGGCEYEKEVTR